VNIAEDLWPICAVCNRRVEDFRHLTNVFEDQHRRIMNSFVASCHGAIQQEAYVAGQAPALRFGPAFSAVSFLV
jgi:hypothetical protein